MSNASLTAPNRVRVSVGLLNFYLEQLEGHADNALSKIKAKLWSDLNDYIHGDAIQVKAKNTKNDMADNYNPDHLACVLQSSLGLAYSASVAIAKLAENTGLANKLMALHQRFASGS